MCYISNIYRFATYMARVQILDMKNYFSSDFKNDIQDLSYSCQDFKVYIEINFVIYFDLSIYVFFKFCVGGTESGRRNSGGSTGIHSRVDSVTDSLS